MSKRKLITAEEAMNEICMDSASEDDYSSDEEDVCFDPDLVIEYDSDAESTVSSASSRSTRSTRVVSSTDDDNQPSTSAGRRGMSGRGRGRRAHATTTTTSRESASPSRSSPTHEWEIPEPRHGDMSDVPPFIRQAGLQETINVSADDPHDARGYFDTFMGHEIFELFPRETNRYAEQVRAKKPNFYYLRNWRDTSAAEMKVMVALLMAMGLVPKPEMSLFWSKIPIIDTPFFRKQMSRDRFLALLTFWHLSDNENQPGKEDSNHDKLYKIRPLFDHLNKRFSSVYYPEQQIAVDESMMPWKGRVAFRQYIPSKPIKYGMKLYCCCESSSGYILKMLFYTGANTTAPQVGHGQQVVRDVAADYMNAGHTIYMDSFFSAVQLYEDLLQKGTSACGTIIRNRKGLPQTIMNTKTCKLRKGEHVVRQKGKLLVCRFHDKKDVTFLSTAHTAEPTPTGKLHKKTKVPIIKPALVDHYNRHMKGVDQLDQNLSYYSFNRKTLKWWKRAATHLIHMTKVQAYTLYKKQTAEPLSQLNFTLKLIESLAAENQTVRQNPPAADVLQNDRLSHSSSPHFPPQAIPQTGKKAKPTKNCTACTITKSKNEYLRRKETRYQCKSFLVPLCIEPCFEIYHKHVDYKREIRRRCEAENNL